MLPFEGEVEAEAVDGGVVLPAAPVVGCHQTVVDTYVDGLLRVGDVDREPHAECRLEVEILLACEVTVPDLNIGVGTEERGSEPEVEEYRSGSLATHDEPEIGEYRNHHSRGGTRFIVHAGIRRFPRLSPAVVDRTP